MMDVLVITAERWQRAARSAAGKGATVLVSPPVSLDGMDEVLQALSRPPGVLYLNLHGFPNNEVYYGQAVDDKHNRPAVLTPSLIRSVDWGGTVVFAEVCYSTLNTPKNRRVPAAFFEQGARAFVGSRSIAYGNIAPLRFLDGEADRLAAIFIHQARHGRRPKLALRNAKFLLRILSIPLDDEDRQTLNSFQILTKETI